MFSLWETQANGRDLSPENIFVMTSRDAKHVRILEASVPNFQNLNRKLVGDTFSCLKEEDQPVCIVSGFSVIAEKTDS